MPPYPLHRESGSTGSATSGSLPGSHQVAGGHAHDSTGETSDSKRDHPFSDPSSDYLDKVPSESASFLAPNEKHVVIDVLFGLDADLPGSLSKQDGKRQLLVRSRSHQHPSSSSSSSSLSSSSLSLSSTSQTTVNPSLTITQPTDIEQPHRMKALITANETKQLSPEASVAMIGSNVLVPKVLGASRSMIHVPSSTSAPGKHSSMGQGIPEMAPRLDSQRSFALPPPPEGDETAPDADLTGSPTHPSVANHRMNMEEQSIRGPTSQSLGSSNSISAPFPGISLKAHAPPLSISPSYAAAFATPQATPSARSTFRLRPSLDPTSNAYRALARPQGTPIPASPLSGDTNSVFSRVVLELDQGTQTDTPKSTHPTSLETIRREIARREISKKGSGQYGVPSLTNVLAMSGSQTPMPGSSSTYDHSHTTAHQATGRHRMESVEGHSRRQSLHPGSRSFLDAEMAWLVKDSGRDNLPVEGIELENQDNLRPTANSEQHQSSNAQRVPRPDAVREPGVSYKAMLTKLQGERESRARASVATAGSGQQGQEHANIGNSSIQNRTSSTVKVIENTMSNPQPNKSEAKITEASTDQTYEHSDEKSEESAEAAFAREYALFEQRRKERKQQRKQWRKQKQLAAKRRENGGVEGEDRDEDPFADSIDDDGDSDDEEAFLMSKLGSRGLQWLQHGNKPYSPTLKSVNSTGSPTLASSAGHAPSSFATTSPRLSPARKKSKENASATPKVTLSPSSKPVTHPASPSTSTRSISDKRHAPKPLGKGDIAGLPPRDPLESSVPPSQAPTTVTTATKNPAVTSPSMDTEGNVIASQPSKVRSVRVGNPTSSASISLELSCEPSYSAISEQGEAPWNEEPTALLPLSAPPLAAPGAPWVVATSHHLRKSLTPPTLPATDDDRAREKERQDRVKQAEITGEKMEDIVSNLVNAEKKNEEKQLDSGIASTIAGNGAASVGKSGRSVKDWRIEKLAREKGIVVDSFYDFDMERYVIPEVTSTTKGKKAPDATLVKGKEGETPLIPGQSTEGTKVTQSLPIDPSKPDSTGYQDPMSGFASFTGTEPTSRMKAVININEDDDKSENGSSGSLLESYQRADFDKENALHIMRISHLSQQSQQIPAQELQPRVSQQSLAIPSSQESPTTINVDPNVRCRECGCKLYRAAITSNDSSIKENVGGNDEKKLSKTGVSEPVPRCESLGDAVTTPVLPSPGREKVRMIPKITGKLSADANSQDPTRAAPGKDMKQHSDANSGLTHSPAAGATNGDPAVLETRLRPPRHRRSRSDGIFRAAFVYRR